MEQTKTLQKLYRSNNYTRKRHIIKLNFRVVLTFTCLQTNFNYFFMLIKNMKLCSGKTMRVYITSVLMINFHFIIFIFLIFFFSFLHQSPSFLNPSLKQYSILIFFPRFPSHFSTLALGTYVAKTATKRNLCFLY